jgi:hypothetical protein
MAVATVSQFIEYVGHQEAVQLTHIDNPDIDSVDYAKVQAGLDSAYNLLTQKVSPSWSMFAEAQIRLTRKLLDPYTTREVVTMGYDEVWEWIANRTKLILWI